MFGNGFQLKSRCKLSKWLIALEYLIVKKVLKYCRLVARTDLILLHLFSFLFYSLRFRHPKVILETYLYYFSLQHNFCDIIDLSYSNGALFFLIGIYTNRDIQIPM